eukprot:SM000041S15468  [mRNA]  locus=s41:195460:198723:- [translate_table: standard]
MVATAPASPGWAPAAFPGRRGPPQPRPRHREEDHRHGEEDVAVFDPLGLGPAAAAPSAGFGLAEHVLALIGGRGPSRPGPGGQPSPSSGQRGSAGAIEDSSIDFGDFFQGNLPKKFIQILALLALSRVGIYIPLPGVNLEAFSSSLGEGTLLGTLDTLSGGGIGRVGIFSLGIVPYINAQIVFQLFASLFPKLQDLQKKEGEAGRNKLKRYTQFASVGFAVVQAVGQVFFLRPYVDDFSTSWVATSVAALTLGSVAILWIAEQLSELKLGNGTSLLIFTNIVSYLPSTVGRTIAQANDAGNYGGLVALLPSFFLLVFGIVYVQEAERKIPINYAQRFTSRGVTRAAYLPFKVNSTGVMPIIFSTSLLAAPVSLARFTGAGFLKSAAVALYPGGAPHWPLFDTEHSGIEIEWLLYLPTNVLLIAFFNYFYTFLQLDPSDVSEQLKRQGASIPAVRPGKATATFITNVLAKISVLGSAFLGVMAAAPAAVEAFTHLTAFRGFAGTSILILVGCASDTARKVQAELVSQKYRTIEMYDVNKDIF